MEETNNKYKWSRLNPLQLGGYAEYFTKTEFTLLGFDIYTTEIDDIGIDFVIRRSAQRYYDVQVKSTRGLNYVFMPKEKFPLSDNMLAALVIFFEGKPPFLYLVPATAWCQPNALCVGHDYEGKKSKPEWGLNLSQKNMSILEQFEFCRIATIL